MRCPASARSRRRRSSTTGSSTAPSARSTSSMRSPESVPLGSRICEVWWRLEGAAARHRPQLLAGSLCLGLAAANVTRIQTALTVTLAALLGGAAAVACGQRRVGLLAVALALARLVVGERTSRCARSQSLDVSPRDGRPRAHDRHRAVAPRKVRRARAGGRHGIRGASFARARAAEAAAWTGSPARRDPGSARPSDGPARTEERVRRTDVASTSRRARRPPRRPLADRRASRRAGWRCGHLATTAAALRCARAERLSRGRARGRRPRRRQRALGRAQTSLPRLRALSPPGGLGTKRGTRRRQRVASGVATRRSASDRSARARWSRSAPTCWRSVLNLR